MRARASIPTFTVKPGLISLFVRPHRCLALPCGVTYGSDPPSTTLFARASRVGFPASWYEAGVRIMCRLLIILCRAGHEDFLKILEVRSGGTEEPVKISPENGLEPLRPRRICRLQGRSETRPRLGLPHAHRRGTALRRRDKGPLRKHPLSAAANSSGSDNPMGPARTSRPAAARISPNRARRTGHDSPGQEP